jgi:hypothetical protein
LVIRIGFALITTQLLAIIGLLFAGGLLLLWVSWKLLREIMHERKRRMAERSDAFVALPGGIGTFEELFEVWSWRHLAYHDRPIALLDVERYFEPLLTMLERAVAAGFMTQAQMAMIDVDDDPARLLRALAVKAARATAPDDQRRI